MRIFADERMLAHDAGPGHPERPDRLRAILERLAEHPIAGTEVVPPRQADRADLVSLHDPAYVDRILALNGQAARLDPDTAVSEGSIPAALLAAGGALDVVDLLCATDGPSRAFSLGRPPGHHAEHARAMGFCLFDNIALAADRAVREHGLERVLILDWDVHHGNGTQHLLEDRGDIAVVNLHQAGIFPGTGFSAEVGHGAGEGATVNVALPGGCGDAEYLAAMRAVVEPFCARFGPELILVSAGFDAHRWDPLAGQSVTTGGFARLCAETVALAEEYSGGRIGLVLEGGYDLEALADSVRACAAVLAGAPARTAPPAGSFDAGSVAPASTADFAAAPANDAKVSPAAQSSIERTVAIHGLGS